MFDENKIIELNMGLTIYDKNPKTVDGTLFVNKSFNSEIFQSYRWQQDEIDFAIYKAASDKNEISHDNPLQILPSVCPPIIFTGIVHLKLYITLFERPSVNNVLLCNVIDDITTCNMGLTIIFYDPVKKTYLEQEVISVQSIQDMFKRYEEMRLNYEKNR